MAELIDVANALFKNKNNWVNISEEDKNKYFFIFNRYFSKKYPTKAQLLNMKSVEKSTALDLWFYFFKDKSYPQWFWSKSPKSEIGEIDQKDFLLLMDKLNLNKSEDLVYLIENYSDLIKEELKFYKNKK
jgi:hypothetical protein